MKKQPFYKNTHFVIPVSALGINILLGEILCYINLGRTIPFNIFYIYFIQAWPIILETIALFYLVYYTVLYFNKKYAATPNSVSRFLQELLLISIAGFIVQEIFRNMFIRFCVVPESPVTLEPKLRRLQMVSMTFLFIIYSLLTTVRIFRYLQQKQLELMQWQKEYAQSQFEVLKNQLNPHFLFNSLSVLTSLVYVDADKAEEFIEKLSKTYRYLLEQKDKEKVALKKEIEFLQAYNFLVEQRFGKKLQLNIGVDSSELKKTMLPHALMIAMEYIIGNNAMSTSKPLLIEVKTVNSQLEITYSHFPKAQIESNSTEQLNGLKERYRNITERPMEVFLQDDKNIIRYPLLQEDERE